MAASYLMDTNVLIDYTSRKFGSTIEQKLDGIFDDSFHYSIISRIEILGYNTLPEILRNIGEFLSNGVMHYITDEISDQTIDVRRLLPKLKLPDAIIGATALVHNHTLLTRNIDDFKNIPELQIDNPWNW